MNINIFEKLLVIMLIITLIPLAFISFASINDAKQLGLDSAAEAENMGNEAIFDATASLNQLGADMIKQKAIDVAKQLEIYIISHPEMTVADLQKDTYFSALAVQPVGKTGYTAVHDANSFINRFHKKETTVNSNLSGLATKLPGFWKVLEPSKGGKVSEGFYDWDEADGSIKQKYMYIVAVDAKTADGVTFGVAATTYIDEFSSPVVETQQKISSSIEKTKESINAAVDRMEKTLWTIMLLAVIFVILVCFSFARSISKPIKALKDAAEKVTNGEFDVALPPAKGSDEVAELTGAVEMLIASFKAQSEAKAKEAKPAAKKK